jgi:hypothetical protein
MEPFDRRTFLRRGGMLSAALGAAAVLPWPLVQRALAAPAARLTGTHRRTLHALLETVAAGPDVGYHPSSAARARSAFDGWFEAQEDSLRGQVSMILDAVDIGYERGPFADAPTQRRLEHVRKWAYPYSDVAPPPLVVPIEPENELEQIRRNAPHAARRPDSDDPMAIDPVPLAYDPPPLTELPELSAGVVNRALVMEGALYLVAQSFHPGSVGSARAVYV